MLFRAIKNEVIVEIFCLAWQNEHTFLFTMKKNYDNFGLINLYGISLTDTLIFENIIYLSEKKMFPLSIATSSISNCSACSL